MASNESGLLAIELPYLLLRYLNHHLENPKHYPLVKGCNTLTPKAIRLSKIQQTTNPLNARPLSEKS